jgi:hypothetical protein
MKKLLVGLLALGSISAFANDPVLSKIDLGSQLEITRDILFKAHTDEVQITPEYSSTKCFIKLKQGADRARVLKAGTVLTIVSTSSDNVFDTQILKVDHEKIKSVYCNREKFERSSRSLEDRLNGVSKYYYKAVTLSNFDFSVRNYINVTIASPEEL